ncbi:MAG: FISUMP domain-containing protein [Actinomycetota bacterium]
MKKGLTFFALVSLVALVSLFQGCKKPTIPELTTAAISEIGLTTAKSGGTIIADGGAEITEKGVCWSTTANPTISDSRTSDGTGTDSFVSNLVGLAEGTPYFVRAYATNEAGTAYGNELTFTTNQVTGAVLTTTEVTNVTSTTATAGGNITSTGGGTILARGICWGTTPNPTISGNKTTNGTGEGVFTGNLTGLTDGTVYYYRAYATNSSGVTYGQELSFITPVTDIEGNLYKTVMIGTKVWMAENLKVTELNDDSEIPHVSEAVDWIVLNGPGYCWFNNDSAYNAPIYGALYNWYAANLSNICPTGWHVPTDAEFSALEVALGLPLANVDIWGWRGTDHGSKMKSTTGWNAGENGTNTSGFTALPGGYRFYTDGTYQGQKTYEYFWTATEHDADRGWYRRLDGNNAAVYKASTDKRAGKAIRCVKN